MLAEMIEPRRRTASFFCRERGGLKLPQKKYSFVRKICGCRRFPRQYGGTAIVMRTPTVSVDYRLRVTCHNRHSAAGGTAMGFRDHAAPRSKGQFGRGGRAGERCHPRVITSEPANRNHAQNMKWLPPTPVLASSVQSPADASRLTRTSGRAHNASCLSFLERFVFWFSEAPMGEAPTGAGELLPPIHPRIPPTSPS